MKFQLASMRHGFTLAETILVVTILAILMAISTPSIFAFMKQRDTQQEQNTLQEVRRALQAYLADKNKLPDMSSWATDLAGYTNLSAEQMQVDQWGRPRAFITLTDPSRNIQEAPVRINYVTILSSGADHIATSAPGIAVSGKDFAPYGDGGWWANKPLNQVTAAVTQFGILAAAGDDQLVKFTDYPEKLDRYQQTLDRMERINNALESHARAKYSEAVMVCAAKPRNADGKTGDVECDTPGLLEKKIYYPNTVDIANDAQRRTDMTNLMRLLGLPDEFCCSALDSSADNKSTPFFFFNNPRPRAVGGGCGVRPGTNDQKLPARITTVNTPDTSTNPPPTCG